MIRKILEVFVYIFAWNAIAIHICCTIYVTSHLSDITINLNSHYNQFLELVAYWMLSLLGITVEGIVPDYLFFVAAVGIVNVYAIHRWTTLPHKSVGLNLISLGIFTGLLLSMFAFWIVPPVSGPFQDKWIYMIASLPSSVIAPFVVVSWQKKIWK